MISGNVQGFIDWASKLSVLGVVVLFVVGLQQRWWYLQGEVGDLKTALAEQKEATAAMEKDRDQWKLLYLTSVRAGERVASAATVALPVTEPTAS